MCLFITGVEKMLIPFLYPILLGIVTSNIGFSTGVLLTGYLNYDKTLKKPFNWQYVKTKHFKTVTTILLQTAIVSWDT